MPYKSQAQAAYFNQHKRELESQGVDVNEWNRASKGLKLPKRLSPTKKMKAKTAVKKMAKKMGVSKKNLKPGALISKMNEKNEKREEGKKHERNESKKEIKMEKKLGEHKSKK